MAKFLTVAVVAALVLGACGQGQQTRAEPGTACNDACRAVQIRQLLAEFKTEHVDPLDRRVEALEGQDDAAASDNTGGVSRADDPLFTRDRLPQDVDIAEIPGARLRHIPERRFCAVVPPPGRDYDRAALEAVYRDRCPH